MDTECEIVAVWESCSVKESICLLLSQQKVLEVEIAGGRQLTEIVGEAVLKRGVYTESMGRARARGLEE